MRKAHHGIAQRLTHDMRPPGPRAKGRRAIHEYETVYGADSLKGLFVSAEAYLVRQLDEPLHDIGRFVPQPVFVSALPRRDFTPDREFPYTTANTTINVT